MIPDFILLNTLTKIAQSSLTQPCYITLSSCIYMSTDIALWSKANLTESKFRHQKSLLNTFQFVSALDHLSHVPIPYLHDKSKRLEFISLYLPGLFIMQV